MTTTEPVLRVEKALKEKVCWHGRVVGVYEHAVSIRTDDSDLVSLLTTVPGGPCSAHVIPSVPGRVKPGMPAEGHHGTLTLGEEISLDLNLAPAWDATLPRITLPAPDSIKHTIKTLERYIEPPAITGQDGMESALHQALISDTKLQPVISNLIGRGVGLTPEGDDVIIGLLAGADLLHSSTVQIIQETVENGLEKTTWIGQCFLRFALERKFAEPVIRLFQALTREDEPSFQQAAASLTTVGATSGIATLRGILTVLRARSTFA